MNISSQAFGYKQEIPKKYTCDGANISPPLMVSGTPSDTVSFVLVVDDPDAPSGIFTHWLLFGIPGATTSIPEGGYPPGSVQGVNDFGHTRYDGPCPPNGEHRYYFKLYALDTMLEIGSGASRNTIVSAMHGHIIDRSEAIGVYGAEKP